MASDQQLAAETFVWGLRTLCALHRIPFAPEIAAQQYPPPYSLRTLALASNALGLNCELRAVPAAELNNLPRPFLALRAMSAPPADGAGEAEVGMPVGLAIGLQLDETSITFLEPGKQRPVTTSLDEFAARFTGEVMLFTASQINPKAEDTGDDIALRFGFRWFVPELLRHKSIWRDVLLASFAIQLMALATPVFTQVIIDKVIVHQTTSTLAVIAIALGVFIVFSAVMSWVRQLLVLHTGNRIDAVLGLNVFEHLFRLPPRYFERRPTGVLVARLQGVETIRDFLSSAAITLFLDVPFVFIFLVIMAYYSLPLTLVVCVILVLIIGLSAGITPLLRARLNRQFLLGARNQAFLTEYVAGMETVKSLQLEPQLGRRFGDYLAAYLESGFRTKQLVNSYNVSANLLEQLMTLTILCLGAWMVMTGQNFTIGMLVAFQMFASRLAQPLLHLVGLWQQFQQATIAVRRLGDIMDAPAEPYSLVPSREAKRQGAIEIRGLGFRYAKDLPYLFKRFTLSIEPGKSIAIMGPSGSGKSTLARLLQGFYHAEEGTIALDGTDTRYLSANELRQYFGVVPQETVLFSGTIYDNLALANPHAAFEQVIQACKLAEIHETIEQLPLGYQTSIGEHGAGLSGGQKQRIAIARALLKRPRILIFDEATSSLDSATAEQFARTVNQFRGRVTLIFIAHQLPKGLQVDSVVTLGQWGTRMGVVGEERRDV